MALAAVTTVVGVVVPQVAAGAAVTRFVSPNGTGAACTAAEPCDLDTALAASVATDEVVLTTGAYTTTTFTVETGVTLRGATPGAGRPVVNHSGSIIVLGTMRDVDVRGGIVRPQLGGLADRILVSSSGDACVVRGATLSNSVCRSAGGNGTAILAQGEPSRLVNVTGQGAGTGWGIGVLPSSTGVAIENSIALGGGGGVDLRSTGVATIVNSYYVNLSGTPASEVGRVSSGGSFDADLRPLVGSTTINAGAAGSVSGDRDLAYAFRTIGGGPDIGAYEQTGQAPAVESASTASTTANAFVARSQVSTRGVGFTYRVEWGTVPGTYPWSIQSTFAGGADVRVLDTNVGGLDSNTTYYWRATVLTGGGSAVSSEQQATTVSRSSTIVSTTPNPSRPGEDFEVTAEVRGEGPEYVSGTVTFRDDAGTVLAAGVPLRGTGRARTTLDRPAGSLTIVATFDGTPAVATSTSAPYRHTIVQGTTDVTLVSAKNPARVGETVTLTATVVDDRGQDPDGLVRFAYDGNVIDVPVVAGVATTTASASTATTVTATATFLPDDRAGLAGSADTLDQVWAQSATTTQLTSNLNPSQVGDAVTFTATVVDDVGAPVTAGSVSFSDGGAPLGAAVPVDGAGRATLTTSALVAGQHAIGASYSGTTVFVGSNAAGLTQSVSLRPTVTAVTSTADPSPVGDAVTITATVTDGGAPVTAGTVTFTEGATVLASGVALDANGQATLTTSTLTVGEHPITATYSGTAATATSNATVDQTVDLRTTTVAIGSSTNPSTFGQSVTFTATVTDTATGDPVAGGTVDVFVDDVEVATDLALDAQGRATWSSSSLAVGDHDVRVEHSGVAGVRVGGTGTVRQVVGVGPSSTALTSSGSPSTLGDDATFTAQVSGPGATPTGSVIFSDGATLLGTVAIDGTGRATLTTSALAVGPHPVTAAYNGGPSHAGSTSATLDHEVERAGTTTGLTTSGSPSYVGLPVTFTATVTADQAGPATGQVRFTDGATVLGTVDLVGGRATLTTPDLALGDHLVAAEYLGSTDHTSSSANLTHTVEKEPTGTTLATTDPTTAVGDSVTFTATVTGDGRTPVGTVIFRDGATILGSDTLDGAGIATFTTSTLAAGSRTVTATFEETGTFLDSQGSVGQAVGAAASATAVTSSLDPSTYATSVTITATVSGNGPTPTGTVTFTEGVTVLAADVPLVAGVASFSTATLAGGAHPITATYSGSSEHDPSTGSIVQDVDRAPSVTVVPSFGSQSTYGDGAVLTAVVSRPGAVGEDFPTGTVTFTEGATVLAADVPISADRATAVVDGLSGGVHTITATYSGDGDHLPSSGTGEHTVVPTTATITLTSSHPVSSVGEDVTFTAVLTSDAGVPTGEVRFSGFSDGLVLAPIDATGTATITRAFTTPRTFTIEASYDGDGDFQASSQYVDVEVQQADAGGPYTVAEGDGLVLDATPSVNRSQATFAWDLDGDGEFDDAAGDQPTISPAGFTRLGLGDGPLTAEIAVAVTDSGSTSVDAAELTVTNTTPSTYVELPTTTARAGEPVTIYVGAEDPSAADMAGLFDYTVDWGDGTDPDQARGPADPPFTHTYAVAGEYEVTAVAADSDGVVGPATVVVITVLPAVVVDPPTVDPPVVPPTYVPPVTTYTPPSTTSGPLARTGAGLGPVALLGLLMGATGLALALGARRPRRAVEPR